MNELALFAGAGGGILGGKLLGWRTVCAVEWEQYPASVLCARQNDGLLPPFPIWDDVQTFDGKPWRGIVDVVSGGFPCQDISAAGGGEESMVNDQECGEKWHASFAKYNPDLCLWKTPQCSLLGDLEEFSETWPQWGLMRNGECWEQRTLEQNIKGTESGSLPTPVKSDYKGTSKNSKFVSRLIQYRAWDDGTGASTLYPKPSAYEALMGWPVGWTDLKPLAMDKSHCAPQQHGESSQKESE